jgi:hypothetical protein
MQARKLDRPQSGWQKVADRTGATLQECSSELRGCRIPAREGLKLPLLLLGDDEAARDPLQIFLLVLSNPHGGLWVA